MAGLLKRFAGYYRPHRGLFALDFTSAVASGLLELAFPVAVTLFIDKLLPTGQLGVIAIAAIGLLAIYVVNAFLQVIVTYWGHMLGIKIETEMRRKAFDHLQKLSFGFFDNQKTGHLVARLTKDLEEIGEVAHHGPEDVFIAIMTLIGAFILMLWVHPQLALITAVIVPLSAYVTARYGGRMTHTWHALYRRVGDFNARIEENVGGIRVVQAFTNEDHERQLFAESNDKYLTTKLAAYKIMAASMSLSYLSMRFVQVVVMLAGAWFVVRGELTAGGFVGFLLLVNVFFRPIEKINSVIETYPKGIAGFQRYTEFLDTRPDIADRPGAQSVARLTGDIEYRDVSFGYSTERPIVDGLDISIRAGETIAFVGPSGAGKTTICSLLPRFYDVTKGAILADGSDIRDMTLKSLRSNIGIVSQDVFLFAGTIRENIAYGRLDATDAEIVEAARRARLDGVIANLPEGYDTVIGERGVKLSGGQKQRMAIARIFLKNPPILILDEATSALDTETERAIQQSLAELSQGRTTLVIAHRLATIVNADRILVVEGGRIAEQGSHAELLSMKDGRYKRLHIAQAGLDQGHYSAAE
ncbi:MULTISPECIES: ABC transporter ATP-binding protein [Brucella]|jgi:ATP-binding cassette, subfamily B, bacterial|uniref:ABC transporter ATP-binding protein n=1 Tax=Brucella lupini TaxID=255457 RepID=A0AB34DM28_9HYPH|nr:MULTISPECIES: ABC transporter ATP-binding protein [Brucella/Ochrobactrum group]RNL47978.1 ABC transporter ATP-binding protein [Ochrobactrum sp. MH181795]KAB2704566.1 ABC transporter ATP-binding protein [Brucella lupini]KAB2724605.1 ABC transporter ATP-binding protein [Brucella anthropi]KAB2738957.1 ABC transporter ATP-binding protein [Brucella anthropi]KAB2797826.1 ABC transporter ATP-binding protein [Brucella anthropi]